MPPKNNNITKVNKKQSKHIAQPEYKLITRDEMKAKEIKYFHQLEAVQKCLNIIDDALLEIQNQRQQQTVKDKWQNFLYCNPLPKPYIPPDIRLFYSKLKYFEQENIEKNISCLLSANERSILTQDFNYQDLTQRNLTSTLKENIGEKYNNYVTDSLKILHTIENFLDNDVEVAKCPMNIMDDIMSRKLAIQNEIEDLINRFTYRIISAEHVEMNSIDSISAEYNFRAYDFEIHIWCLKNVALRISHLSEPRLLINFHSIKLLLQVPSEMLKENLVIRAIHMSFDYFSENAKSFSNILPAQNENLNVGILDLHKCLIKEWLMQKDIQAKLRQVIVKKHLEYEEQMRQYDEQLERKKSARKEKENKAAINTKKLVKPIKEPFNMGNDEFPDTYEQFLQEEQEQYENFCKSVYEPKLLNLSSDEINLRKYFILGGIYQLYYVEKPMQINFNGLNVTWHRNEGQLEINKNIIITAKTRLSTQFRRSTKRMTIFEAENQYIDPNTDSPWFIVTIELPQYLCLWGEPIACYFEKTIKKVKKLQALKPEESKVVVNNNNTSNEQEADLSSLINLNCMRKSVVTTGDNKYDSLTESAIQTKLNEAKRLNRKYDAGSQQLFCDSVASTALQNKKSQSTERVTLSCAPIKDFSLKEILTKPQIRHIEKLILPCIISSYKFPKEIQLEELQILSEKPKRTRARLIRRKIDNFPTKIINQQFSFSEQQNNPERIFPQYPKEELLSVFSYIKELNVNNIQMDPETFAQLLQVVSEIRRKYRLRYYRIMDLKPLEQEIITYNKRIKQMLRRKEQDIARATTTSILTSRSTILTSATKRSIQKSRKSERTLSKQSDFITTDRATLTEINSENAFPESIKYAPSVLFDTEEENDVESYWHWTTKPILKSEFDRKNCKIVLQTDRLGNFGFAFKRYEHFPFKYWSMEPNKNNPENEIIFTLDTQHVRCVLYITANGIRGYVIEPSTTLERKPNMYLMIEKPIKEFKEFKKLFKEKYLNIFADPDACYYMENGYFSEKHLSNELHTYNCMAIHSTQMLFNISQWNRLATRRDIILHFKHYQDVAENRVEVLIRPGEAVFVETQELCSYNMDIINLNYNLTWRNIEFCCDLHHLILSMYPTANDLRCKNPNLICHIRNLLSEIRLLSFS